VPGCSRQACEELSDKKLGAVSGGSGRGIRDRSPGRVVRSAPQVQGESKGLPVSPLLAGTENPTDGTRTTGVWVEKKNYWAEPRWGRAGSTVSDRTAEGHMAAMQEPGERAGRRHTAWALARARKLKGGGRTNDERSKLPLAACAFPRTGRRVLAGPQFNWTKMSVAKWAAGRCQRSERPGRSGGGAGSRWGPPFEGWRERNFCRSKRQPRLSIDGPTCDDGSGREVVRLPDGRLRRLYAAQTS